MKKKYKKKQFEKKLLKRIYSEKDKDFFQEAFRKEEDFYFLKDDLDRKDLKRLKRLLKEIRKSKSPVGVFKIILVVLVVAAALVFNFLFKNRLVERGVTTTLEEVFQAQADVQVSTFSLLRGELTFSEIAVADREHPMKNLFELHTLHVAVNMEQLLMKKAVIPSIECLNIAWNTDRETSGALEGDETLLSETLQEQASVFAQDALEAINLPTESPEEIIQAQLENLASKKLIEETTALYKEKKEYWEGQIEEVKSLSTDLSEQAASLMNVNPRKITSIEDARKIAADIDTVRKQLTKAGGTISSLKESAEADIETLKTIPEEIKTAINTDKDYLLNLIQLPEGGLKETLKGIADRYLQSKFGRFYGYLEKGKTIYSRISTYTEGRKGKGTFSRITGGVRKNNREVPYPSVGYPKFLLENLHVSSEEIDASQELYVRNVSSNPALWDKPIELDISWLKASRGVDIQGILDPSDEGEIEGGSVAADFQGFAFDAGELLKKLDVSSYTGDVGGGIAFDLYPDTSISGTGNIVLSNAEVSIAGEGNIVTRRIVKILKENDLNLLLTFSIQDETPSLTIESDLFDIIEAETKELLSELLEELKSKMEEALKSYLAPYLEENEYLAAGFETIEEILGEEELSLDSIGTRLNQKKKELLNSVEEQVKEKVEEEVREKAEEIVDDLLGDSPIKLPSF